MDQDKKSWSFQNINMTYDDVTHLILEDYVDANVIFNGEDKKIDTLIIQYEETDWEFFKRLASMCHTSIAPLGVSHKPQFYFGFPERKEIEKIEPRETRISFSKEYYKFREIKYNFSNSFCQGVLSNFSKI